MGTCRESTGVITCNNSSCNWMHYPGPGHLRRNQTVIWPEGRGYVVDNGNLIARDGSLPFLDIPRSNADSFEKEVEGTALNNDGKDHDEIGGGEYPGTALELGD